jgi:hypothetical protein
MALVFNGFELAAVLLAVMIAIFFAYDTDFGGADPCEEQCGDLALRDSRLGCGPVSALHSGIHRVLTVAIGAFVTMIAFFDDFTVGPIVIALAAVLPVLLTFAITAGVYSLVQYAACRWLLRRWEEWIHGNGQRLERRLEKWRNGRILKYPVNWITHGSIFWFGLASVIFASVVVVSVAQLASDEPVPHRRVILSSAIYGVWFAALYTSIGYGIGEGVRSP